MSLALLALVHAPFAAQSATPAPATRALETLPPRACSVGAAFDERRECLVLFGGKRPGPGYVGETFEHDKGGWRQVATGGPSPRNSPTTAYDARRGVTVLFGGDDRRGAFGDTWAARSSAL